MKKGPLFKAFEEVDEESSHLIRVKVFRGFVYQVQSAGSWFNLSCQMRGLHMCGGAEEGSRLRVRDSAADAESLNVC